MANPGNIDRHLRGLWRLGIASEDVETFERCIEIIAKWAGKDTSGWPRISDVALT